MHLMENLQNLEEDVRELHAANKDLVAIVSRENNLRFREFDVYNPPSAAVVLKCTAARQWAYAYPFCLLCMNGAGRKLP